MNYLFLLLLTAAPCSKDGTIPTIHYQSNEGCRCPPRWTIYCPKCGCSAESMYGTLESAVLDWNLRDAKYHQRLGIHW